MRSHKPSAQVLSFRDACGRYRKRIGSAPPDWVKALGMNHGQSILELATRLGWRLPTRTLIEEDHDGRESLWATRQTYLDYETEFKNRGFFLPRDLMDMPVDPAELAGRTCKKRHLKRRTFK